jgi:ATP-dependent Clp protease ATP-binding subunit ClpA
MIGARFDPLDVTERSTRVPSFSNTLEQAIHAALANANARRHELATLEHLLLALIDEPDAQKVMKACSVDPKICARRWSTSSRMTCRPSSPMSTGPRRCRPPPSSA